MEREVSTVTGLAVTMIAISALLWIVISTVQVGNVVRVNAVESGVSLQTAIKTGQVESMTVENVVIPAAAAYHLFETNYRVIESSQCKICDKTYDAGQAGKCLLEHLTGKVSLQVIKIGDERYEVIIHKPDCTWESGNCTCGGR
jgi:mannose/fructose/N-acetylgalactosamine-specific phosphotransferase system component IIC